MCVRVLWLNVLRLDFVAVCALYCGWVLLSVDMRVLLYEVGIDVFVVVGG